MSVVYLAMDVRLNRNWAVKEVKKAGNGIKDEIVIGSILAEANLIKSLDHPAIPRIVDIIDMEDRIYIVMDFIEGESLDKVIKRMGPACEEQVTEWGIQVCDVLSYLHSRNPGIIYRDMKPANLMLKPNGRLAIIDFGIAGECGKAGCGGTSVLGTKGFAPPEQYRGITDPRSDIYALGMTMYQLLSGNDPSRDLISPTGEWKAEISEGLAYVIEKCTDPDPENRYGSCEELAKDLEDPSRLTFAWRRTLRRRLASFAASAAVFVMFLAAGVVCNAGGVIKNDNEYALKISTGDVESFYDAIAICPGRPKAYEGLVEYYGSHFVVNKELNRLGNTVKKNAGSLDNTDREASRVFYDVGRLIFSEWNGSFKAKAAAAGSFFQKAAENKRFENRDIAECYWCVCTFMTEQSRTSEHSAAEYGELLDKMKICMDDMEKRTDRESNYDRISLYRVITLFIDDQAVNMSALGIEAEVVRDLLDRSRSGAGSIDSTLPNVLHLQEKMKNEYEGVLETVKIFFDKRDEEGKAGE